VRPLARLDLDVDLGIDGLFVSQGMAGGEKKQQSSGNRLLAHRSSTG
jgi:hypothetical protein